MKITCLLSDQYKDYYNCHVFSLVWTPTGISNDIFMCSLRTFAITRNTIKQNLCNILYENLGTSGLAPLW